MIKLHFVVALRLPFNSEVELIDILFVEDKGLAQQYLIVLNRDFAQASSR